MNRNWIDVASADHVGIGRSNAFMQFCHGEAALLKRIHPGWSIIRRPARAA
jgi:hypothetical protein